MKFSCKSFSYLSALALVALLAHAPAHAAIINQQPSEASNMDMNPGHPMPDSSPAIVDGAPQDMQTNNVLTNGVLENPIPQPPATSTVPQSQYYSSPMDNIEKILTGNHAYDNPLRIQHFPLLKHNIPATTEAPATNTGSYSN